MRTIAPRLERWFAAGDDVVLATVVATRGSAPRPVGAQLAIAGTGETAGGVSGGCVEAAVVGEAHEVLAGGPPRIVTYGEALDELDIGMPCGGEIDVLVQRLEPAWWAVVRERLATGRPFAIRTALDGTRLGEREIVDVPPGRDLATRVVGDPTSGAVAATREAAAPAPGAGDPAPSGGRRVLVEAVAVRPRLVVVGADDLAAALCAQARLLDWRTLVVDARAALATRERLPDADEIVVGRPADVLDDLGLDVLDAVVVCTHVERFDAPALAVAVRSDAFHVGALGSRGHHLRRAAALLDAGLRAEEIGRIAAPAGLDLGGEGPTETAMSIVAEIAAVRRGRSGGRLAATTGRIHGRRAADGGLAVPGRR